MPVTLFFALTALLGLLAPAAPAQAPAGVDSAALASAYLDAGARELVRGARERRRVVDRSIEGYQTTATERISVGVRAVRRDRIVWEREVATRIGWEREGPVRIEVLGARETLPLFVAEAQVPHGLKDYVPRLAFDPADPYLLTGWGDEDDDIPHPLAPGSEAHYRFRSGDTTTIRLPEGRTVRLLELEALPRRKAGHLVQGSFWLDEESHALVRITFRLADDVEMGGDDEETPAFLRPLAGTVDYVTIEYGLWDGRWWLPRTFAARGAARVGKLATVPLLYERTYTGYEVRGEPGGAAPLAIEESAYAPGVRVRCPTRVRVVFSPPGPLGAGEDVDAPAQDSAAVEPADTTLTEAQRRACERYRVVVPEDTAALLASETLSPAPLASGEALLSEAELSSIRAQLGDLPAPAWRVPELRLTTPPSDLGLLRYNRVEGLSLGARAELDLGPLQAAATARLGTADLEPIGELSLAREAARSRLQLSGYRRLVPMDPWARPFSLGGSLSSLLFGRDEADYYRALGVELTGEPGASRLRSYGWRLYAQRERAAEKETDFSLPRLFGGGHSFPANRAAREATQYGAELHLRRVWGRDPLGLQFGGELRADGAVGGYEYARPSLTLRAGFPLPGPFLGLLEGAGGTSFGEPALQHLWHLGGPASLRGYASGVLEGESFWRGRAEVATELPAVRLVLFSDAGWAGSLDRIGTDPWLISAGAGISFLDGLVRLDLARALKSPTGWRLTAYLDAWR